MSRPSIREPKCVHSGTMEQPASRCNVCCDSDFLREWGESWEAWLAENPDSTEARIVALMDASGRYEKVTK